VGEMLLAMWCGFAAHVRGFYGRRAIIRRSKGCIVFRANDGGRWKVYLNVYGDRLDLRLWPGGERVIINTNHTLMFELLDEALERGTRPLSRWTPTAIKDLITTYFHRCTLPKLTVVRGLLA
jgi:hypothetical protein